MSAALQTLEQWRARLAQLSGEDYWRGLEAAARDEELRHAVGEVLPELSSVWDRRIDRRRLLQLLGASLAMLTAGCSRSRSEKIVPYTVMPEGLVPGVPQFWATALNRGGYAHGVLVKTHMGRPIKVEGNPLHPASLGATDVYSQAAALELFDPERSRTCMRGNAVVTPSVIVDALANERHRWSRDGGRGLAMLMGHTSSPTTLRQLAELQRALPEARVYRHEPIDRQAVLNGAKLLVGRAVEPIYDFTNARIVVSLDADFLSSVPGHLRYARQFIETRRKPEMGAPMNRLYAAESAPTLVGARADHRLAVAPSEIEQIARRLAGVLGVMEAGQERLAEAHEQWIDGALADLQRHRGESLVLCGDHQPPAVHAIVHAINARLGNVERTVRWIEPVVSHDGGTLDVLCESMAAGAVRSLLIFDCNPAYSAPRDLPFAQLLSRVPFTLHTGLYRDESGLASQWHAPAMHPFETWSDARAFDGTASIVQPLIEPLYPSRSTHEWLSFVASGQTGDALGHVQATWQGSDADFDKRWHESLANGIVPNTAAASVALEPTSNWQRDISAAPRTDTLELRLTPDHSTWDGRHANSAWLQELPRPLTSLTWGNALLMSPVLAKQLALASGEHVSIEHEGQTLIAPVLVMPTHPERSVSLALGYGRTQAGAVGSDVGVDAYHLRTQRNPWILSDVTLRKVSGRTALALTQHHHSMHGRDMARRVPLADAVTPAKKNVPPPTIYGEPKRHGAYAWGMTIDLNACIGCGVCTIACQAENNIPAVGKDQVWAGREMHWIRVDSNQAPNGGTVFQPVPCMHCELAPCEYVCPVEASVHDSEGLNVQVYNRCIGTRDCSQNCPYKVRRFNFLDYNGYEDKRPLAAPMAVMNPDVTVRSRGVMEKCTYCVQRISRARIQSKLEDRTIQDEEVTPACAAACPTRAIVFGDLQHPASEVNRWRESPRHYVLLEELGTRPRTTYLAAITNPRRDDEESS